MRSARLVVLVVALAAGLAAAYLAMQLGNRETPQTSAPPPAAVVTENVPTVDVLVASRDLAAGTVLAVSDFTWLAWPEENLAASSPFIRRTTRPQARNELAGLVVTSTISRSEPILISKIGASGSMSASIPAGMRAVAVRVSGAALTAGGFILPGDRVDVILTEAETGAPRSTTVLTNVQVLAIDQRTEATEGSQTAIAQASATFLVSQSGAEVLKQAEASGTISLTLRSFADAGAGGNENEERTVVSIIGAGARTSVSVPVPQQP
jgi:pilus assembly protein CpaB